jgi:hypothetical protein
METICPWCGERTPAEPDAQWVYCLHCKRRIEIDNPYPACLMADIITVGNKTLNAVNEA